MLFYYAFFPLGRHPCYDRFAFLLSCEMVGMLLYNLTLI